MKIKALTRSHRSEWRRCTRCAGCRRLSKGWATFVAYLESVPQLAHVPVPGPLRAFQILSNIAFDSHALQADRSTVTGLLQVFQETVDVEISLVQPLDVPARLASLVGAAY